MTYRQIVVPLDCSTWAKAAIPQAAQIARKHHSELILLHVYQSPVIEYADQIALAGMGRIAEQSRAYIEGYLVSLRNQLRQEGVNARYVILEGRSPADAICDFVDAENIDLVVMSTHGRTGLSRMLFGSVAQKVMQNVRARVILIRPDELENVQMIDRAPEAMPER